MTNQRPTTINTINCKPGPLTVQAPDCNAKSTHESSRLTPTSTATPHTSNTRGQHDTYPAGLSSESSQGNAVRVAWTLLHNCADTSRNSWRTRDPPHGVCVVWFHFAISNRCCCTFAGTSQRTITTPTAMSSTGKSASHCRVADNGRACGTLWLKVANTCCNR